MESRWHNAPYDILEEVFKYLGAREIMTCFYVCQQWREALENPVLWRRTVVYLDVDLFEPSTCNLLRMYGGYVKDLKFAWLNPYQPIRWIPQRFQELTKQSVRLLIALTNTKMQLRSFKLVAWFEMHRYKKVIYHLSRFLKNQKHLHQITFSNLNVTIVESLKLLLTCLNSKTTIKIVNITNCCCNVQNFRNSQLIEVGECYENVHFLTVDYVILCGGIFNAICDGKMGQLKVLTVFVKEHDHLQNELKCEDWKKVVATHPSLKVALYFHNNCSFAHVRFFLKKHIPLTSISLCCTKKARFRDQNKTGNMRRAMTLILRNYNETLETMHLHLRNNREISDDLILQILLQCPRLNRFYFDGAAILVKDLQLIRNIFQIRHKGLQNMIVYPKEILWQTMLLLLHYKDYGGGGDAALRN